MNQIKEAKQRAQDLKIKQQQFNEALQKDSEYVDEVKQKVQQNNQQAQQELTELKETLQIVLTGNKQRCLMWFYVIFVILLIAFITRLTPK